MSLTCPQCHSKAFKRNGYTRHGKQNHRCLECGRQFSLEPTDACNSNEMVEFIADISEKNSSDSFP